MLKIIPLKGWKRFGDRWEKQIDVGLTTISMMVEDLSYSGEPPYWIADVDTYCFLTNDKAKKFKTARLAMIASEMYVEKQLQKGSSKLDKKSFPEPRKGFGFKTKDGF